MKGTAVLKAEGDYHLQGFRGPQVWRNAEPRRNYPISGTWVRLLLRACVGSARALLLTFQPAEGGEMDDSIEPL